MNIKYNNNGITVDHLGAIVNCLKLLYGINLIAIDCM